MTITEYLFLFAASIISTVYSLLKLPQDKINRKELLSKLLSAVMVAFFISPAIMEHFKLSLNIAGFVSVIIATAFDRILAATVRRVENEIDKKE